MYSRKIIVQETFYLVFFLSHSKASELSNWLLHLKYIKPSSISISWGLQLSICNPSWRHQMEIFSTLLAICVENSPDTGEFPAQRQVTRAAMFSLICAWMNGWVNNRDASDLRRHHVHYDVIVMLRLTELWRKAIDDDNHMGTNAMDLSNAFDHYGDVIMGAIASQITSFTNVYSTVSSGADQRRHQSSASLVFVGESLCRNKSMIYYSLKSPASRVFAPRFVRAQSKENAEHVFVWCNGFIFSLTSNVTLESPSLCIQISCQWLQVVIDNK